MTVALSPPAEKRQYRFDGFEVDPVRRKLVRGGAPVAVTPKALSLLVILLERRGDVVEKEELIRRLWPDTFVTEANLTQNVSALRKALGERANEHRYVITVPGRGYSFVAEVEEVEAAPSRPEIPIADLPLPASPAAGPSRGRAWLAALVLVLLLAGVAAALLLERRPPAAGPAETRPSLAVLGFKDLSGSKETAWLGPALSEMLTTELAAGGRVRVASGENVARARLSPESLDPDSLERLHGILGCELLVVGSYLPLREAGGARIRLDLRVLRLPGGDTVASLAEVGTEDELFELVARTGAELRRRLGLAGLSPEQAREARALQPGNAEAVRLYAEGLARLRAFDSPQAVKLLSQAVEADPESAPIRSALAQAWSTLGYDARAQAQAARAVELSGSLPRAERLAIQARAHQVSRQWSKAGELYRTLWTFFPDDLEHGLQLARCQNEGGRSAEALATIAELRKLPPPARDDPRIDLVEAMTAMRLPDPALMLAAARRAEAKGRASGESLIVGQGLELQGVGHLIQGDTAAAIRLSRQARTLFEQAGDSLELAATMAFIGLSLQKQGDLKGAEKIYLEALDRLEKLGNVSGVAAQLGNLGILYQNWGDLDRALEVLERSHARFTEIEDPLLESRVLNASAQILFLKGDLDGSRARLEEVLALSRKAGSRTDEARAFRGLAEVLVWKGQVREAGRLAQQAWAILRDRDPAQAAQALSSQADARARQGDLAGARRLYEQALALKRQAGDRIGSAQVLGSLAFLEYRAGNLAAARERSREQLRIADETGARTLRSWAGQGRARWQLAEGDLAAARASLGAALAESLAAGEDFRAMGLRAELARLDLIEGAAGRAARDAGEAADWHRERGNAWAEAVSLSIQAAALAEEGRGAEAREAAARIRALIRRGEDRDLVFTVAPGLARGQSAGGDPAGDPAQALAALDRTAAEAGRLGFLTAALEARLTAAEMRLEQGDPAARGRLEELRREAADRGFRLVARRAEEALTRSRS